MRTTPGWAAPGCPVLVGTDGSGQALRAVGWAAQEAGLRGRPLHIVCCLHGPAEMPPLLAESILDHATTTARLAVAGLDCSTEVRRGEPAAVLTALAADAELLVVGHGGAGGVDGLALGSTALAVSRAAGCPVVVVRAAPGRPVPDRDRPVVVGVDGAGTSEAAVGFAARLAERRGSELLAAHVWTEPLAEVLRRLGRREAEPGREAAERLLAENLAGLPQRHPDLRIRQEVVRGRAACSLLELADSAQLVVLGRRGVTHRHGAPAGMLLRASPCPVAVVDAGWAEARPGRAAARAAAASR